MGKFRPFAAIRNVEPDFPPVTAIVVAAGKSERMGLDKQMMPLGDVPVLARTLSIFERSRTVKTVIVVTRPLGVPAVASMIREFGFTKSGQIVAGGATRQRSVAIGLGLASDAAYVAIHDGARPLATPECVDRVAQAAFRTGAAAAAVRIRDTVKRTDDEGRVEATPDRRNLWLVQTPQIFEMALYRRALAQAEVAGADYTDDCQLVEAIGGRVHLVQGENFNIKLTTKEDIPLAEAILRMRGEL